MTHQPPPLGPRRHARRARSALACAFVAMLILPGCGIKLIYNNADRFILWEVEDYVDLDSEQRAFLKQRLKHIMYWHRETQLPVYAAGLRELETVFRQGITHAHLDDFESRGELWFDEMATVLAPAAAEILMSMSDAQWAALADNLEESNDEYVELADKSDEAIREHWNDDFVDALKSFVGKLTPEQEAYVWRMRERYLPEYDLYVDFRRRWQASYLGLREVRDPDELTERLREHFGRSEAWHGADYAELEAKNRDLYQDMAVTLNPMFTAKQLEKLSERLLDLAEDFEELAADLAKMTRPEPGCLKLCAAPAVPPSPARTRGGEPVEWLAAAAAAAL